MFAERLLKRSADQSFKPVDGFLPMNLCWSHAQGSPEVFADGISPDMGKHCDLGHVTEPTCRAELGEFLDQVPPDQAILALNLEVQPKTRSHLVAPGVYRLVLRIAAANCAPVVKTLELTITGKWFEAEAAMFTDGLGVSVL